MGLSLRKLYNGLNVFDDGTGYQDKTNTQRAAQSANIANARIAAMGNNARGNLSNPGIRQQFLKSNTPQAFNPVSAGIHTVFRKSFIPEVTGKTAGYFGIPTAIDTARLGSAELMNKFGANNQSTIDATVNRLNKNIHEFAPVAFSEGVKPLAQSVATTVTAPYAAAQAENQRKYAERVLTPSYEGLYKAYGQDPRLGALQASMEADQAGSDIRTAPLAKAGINPTDTNTAIARKVLGQAVQAGGNIAFTGKLPQLNPLALGGLNATAALGGEMQKDNVNIKDYAKTGASAFAQGMAIPLAAEYGIKGVKTAAKADLTAPLGESGHVKPGLPKVSAKEKPKVSTKEAMDFVRKIDDNAQKKNRKPTAAEEIRISKKLEAAGIDPATVPASSVKVKEPPKAQIPDFNPYDKIKTPGTIDRAWQSTKGVISQFGEGGKETVKRLEAQRNNMEIRTQKFVEQIPTVNGLSKHEFPTFVQTLDRLSKGERNLVVAPKIQQAVEEWSRSIPEIRKQALNAGLEVGDLGPYYFPRQYPDLFKGGKGIQRMAEQMVKDGKAANRGEALAKLEFMKKEYTKPFGNLEKTRELDLPGYDMNHDALVNYLGRSFDRITKAEQFGPKGEVVNQMLDRMMQDGLDTETAKHYIKIALGDVEYSKTAMKASSVARKFNATTTLGTAGVSNSTQSVNTATIAGIGRTLKAMGQAIGSSEKRAKAKEAGVLLDHSINELTQQGLGAGGKIARNLASPFFQEIERFNREVSALAGADFGNHLAKKGKLDVLREKFGVTGEIGKKLTREQEIQMSRKMVELSQFKVDPMDLPGWANSPMGKVVSQFKPFAYKQSEFMWTQVLKEATHGNFAPLARFVAVGVPAGIASTSIKGVVKRKAAFQNQDGEQDSKKRMAFKGLQAVGGLGMADSAKFLADSKSSPNFATYAAGTIGGPTVGKIAETAQNIPKAFSGDAKPLERQALKMVPTAGPALANTLLPYSSNKTAPVKPGEKATPAQLNAKATEEKKALEKRATSEGNTLQKLSNGRYAYTLDGDTSVHEADDLKSAREAIAKDAFEKGDQDKKLIGDNYYIKKGADGGKTAVVPKVRYEVQQESAHLRLEMDRAKDKKDPGKWADLADKQINAWEREIGTYNPATEQDKIDGLIYKIENLKDKADKYLSNGFGGSGGGKNSVMNDIGRYTISSKGGASFAKPKVSVRDAGSYKSASNSGGGGKPTVTIKKSLV